MDKHHLIQKLKEMALDLGRTPKRDEFTSAIKNTRNKIDILFGGYSLFVIAAGLEPAIKKPKKITNEIFERDIEKVLSTHKQSNPHVVSLGGDKILVIGDCHFPFTDTNCLTAIYQFTEIFQPDYIIQIGDLYDMYSHAKFPRSLNVYTPRDEDRLAREGAAAMWEMLRKIATNARCFQILGNHDVRPLKRVIESAPSLEDDIFEIFCKKFQFEGVELISDPRQELIINNISFIHGYRTKLGDQRDFQLTNCVQGHSHRGGVVFRNQFDIVSRRMNVLFEANAGYVGLPESKALGYTPQKITNWTKGFLAIDAHGPRFISL